MLTRIISNRRLKENLFLLNLQTENTLTGLKPGQFVMLEMPTNSGLILRRPFSVSNVHGRNIEIAYKVSGKGTLIISKLGNDQIIDILGPFGNGFQVEKNIKEAVLVAGGIGIAPFPLLIKNLKKKCGSKLKITLLYGTKSIDELIMFEKFSELADEFFIATEDGGKGYKGYASELLEAILKKMPQKQKSEIMVFASGPNLMLKETDRIALEYGIKCQLSIESFMGCGYGVCLGCAVKAVVPKKKSDCCSSYKLVCKDGPVFQNGEIKWD